MQPPQAPDVADLSDLTCSRQIMVRVLLGKREWVRYVGPAGKLLNDRGWPLDAELSQRLRSAGFDPERPIHCDLVPGTTTLRFRQFEDA